MGWDFFLYEHFLIFEQKQVCYRVILDLYAFKKCKIFLARAFDARQIGSTQNRTVREAVRLAVSKVYQVFVTK